MSDVCVLHFFQNDAKKTTENARPENAGRSKMQDRKMRHQTARVENAGVEMRDQNAGVKNAGQSSMESLFANKCAKANVRMQK